MLRVTAKDASETRPDEEQTKDARIEAARLARK